jgi:hypothetical protein
VIGRDLISACKKQAEQGCAERVAAMRAGKSLAATGPIADDRP